MWPRHMLEPAVPYSGVLSVIAYSNSLFTIRAKKGNQYRLCAKAPAGTYHAKLQPWSRVYSPRATQAGPDWPAPVGRADLGAAGHTGVRQLQSMPTDLARNALRDQLHSRHEILYFKVLAEHLTELMPVAYTPTVGEAIQRFSEEYRGQQGLYLSIDYPHQIADSFETLELGPDDVDLNVCTDTEAILGIGDWGVGGIEISFGKLALYTAGGGIDPKRTIAVTLDVGTDNEQLLQDPFYMGNRHARRRGADYDAFIRRYVETANRLFPQAMLHFEDFGPANARAILDNYARDYCVFNDDVQGTGAVVMAALYAALRVSGIPMKDQKVVVSAPAPPESGSPIRFATRSWPTGPPSNRPTRRSGRSVGRGCCSTTWTTCVLSRSPMRRTGVRLASAQVIRSDWSRR
jgi:Malic enzyme, N-terminal domain